MTDGEIIEKIRETLWLDWDVKAASFFMNPFKEWDTETVESIARILVENGKGPDLPVRPRSKESG